MTDSPIPTFVVAICFGSGILLIALAIPLWLRRVRPNVLYGVRFRSTMASEDVWYDLNARGGRNLVVIAVGYLLLLGLSLRIAAWAPAVRLLLPTTVFVLALILNTVFLRNAASQLAAAERLEKSPKPPS